MKQMPTGSSGMLQLNHNRVWCCFLMFNWYLKCSNFLSQLKLKHYWRHKVKPITQIRRWDRPVPFSPFNMV